ncbi:MAG: RnfABCDGE type electron transport complex subunit B [Oscillospiraceae bacterium]|nr:RnfABCDGE type electron transport complex subunit B [Oscillospiraceae bacterium]
MNPVVLAVLSVTVIAFLCAVMLVIASKVMAVPEDPLFPAVRECLPGANCGACGYAGCDGYAKALATGEEKRTNLCVPGGDGTAANIAGVLGVEAEDVVEMMAAVFCGGDCTLAPERADYQGARTCAAAKLLSGGPKACPYGCLGFGDCANVCPVGAISIVKGIAVVDPKVCIGCGLCSKTCPNHIIHMIPQVQKVFDRCSNPNMGKPVMDVCKAGCIGCTKCAKVCPEGAITMEGNLAHVDHSKCTGCGSCVENCPTKSIQFVDWKKD